jgi:hypothetical protein
MQPRSVPQFCSREGREIAPAVGSPSQRDSVTHVQRKGGERGDRRTSPCPRSSPTDSVPSKRSRSPWRCSVWVPRSVATPGQSTWHDERRRRDRDPRTPALVWLVSSILAVNGGTVAYANELGGGEDFASLSAFVSTVLSMLSLLPSSAPSPERWDDRGAALSRRRRPYVLSDSPRVLHRRPRTVSRGETGGARSVSASRCARRPPRATSPQRLTPGKVASLDRRSDFGTRTHVSRERRIVNTVAISPTLDSYRSPVRSPSPGRRRRGTTRSASPVNFPSCDTSRRSGRVVSHGYSPTAAGGGVRYRRIRRTPPLVRKCLQTK